MGTVTLFTLLAVTVVSLASLIGVFFVGRNKEKFARSMPYLVAFSAGAFLGEVFLHIIPELGEVGIDLKVGAIMLLGVLGFFALEQFVHWHSHGEDDLKPAAFVVLFGDGLHNFIDGVIIATSFIISVPLGIATTVAVLAHELPHEIGDFVVLLRGGFTVAKALLFNLLSALTAVLGAVIALLWAGAESAEPVLMSLAAASFLYVAMSDLLPFLTKDGKAKKTWSFMSLTFGSVLMALLLFLE